MPVKRPFCIAKYPECKNLAEFKSAAGYNRYTTIRGDLFCCNAHRGLHEFNFYWVDEIGWKEYPRCKKEEERGDDNTRCTRKSGHEFPHWLPNKFDEADRKWIAAGRRCESSDAGALEREEIPF